MPKHVRPNTNKFQYILDGTGTIWLGDKEVKVKPGDLVVIPKGTAHGGTKPDEICAPRACHRTLARRLKTYLRWGISGPV